MRWVGVAEHLLKSWGYVCRNTAQWPQCLPGKCRSWVWFPVQTKAKALLRPDVLYSVETLNSIIKDSSHLNLQLLKKSFKTKAFNCWKSQDEPDAMTAALLGVGVVPSQIHGWICGTQFLGASSARFWWYFPFSLCTPAIYSLAPGSSATFAPGLLLKVAGPRATAAAQCVCIVTALSRGPRSLLHLSCAVKIKELNL